MRSILRTILWLSVTALVAAAVHAQIQIGTLHGIITDPAGARVAQAVVTLDNRLTGYAATLTTDARGEFTINNLPFALYALRIAAPGFQTLTQPVTVRSNLPLRLELRLNVAAASATTTITERASLIETNAAGTQTDLNEHLIKRAPGATRSLSLQRLIATTPGWTTQNNGLLHIRGVEDGILYVVDGIPVVDRLDAVSASSFDTEMIRSLRVITGHLPAEFGGRAGAVVQIQPQAGIDLPPLVGSFGASSGSFRAGELAATLGGGFGRKLGFFVAATTSRSDRYLDPVDLGNFNNRGGTAKLNGRFDWHPSARDIVLVDVATNGSDFRVPNREEQELAGQRQRQELRDNAQAASWQRVWSSDWVSNVAFFRRAYQAQLFSSAHDTPISAEQDRRHIRQGLLGSVTYARGSHTFKAGVEATRVTPHEFFTFAITDEEEAEEQEISDAALEFTPNNPFVFRARRTGSYLAWYAQDSFRLRQKLTVHAGLRYDRATLPSVDQQFSPRLGVVYALPRLGAAVRASFNRLFMPPQVENLLLADSAQARALSPFADDDDGGATIKAERVSAYEVGWAQDVRGWFKLDVAAWHRQFRNFDDPNVFFNTTIVFPNSVAKGFARGLDVRLDVPVRRGWSGYLSYTNARILQTGPINGGLFLTDEFIEIGPGTRFVPDHDQRNVGQFGVTYQRGPWWTSLSGRHESGVPLEVEEERLADLQNERGAELVNFERGRVRPWTVFDFSSGVELWAEERVSVSAQFDVQNLADRRFAYNFGNPFEGTHFGYPRLWSGRLKLTFR